MRTILFLLLLLININTVPIYSAENSGLLFSKMELNSITAKKLRFFFRCMNWSMHKADKIIAYRKELHFFEDIAQLATLTGLNKKFATQLENYFCIDKTKPFIQKNYAFSIIDSSYAYRQHLKQLLKKPININQATAQELETVPLINRYYAKLIIKARKKRKHGFNKRWELLKIVGITPKLYRMIRPFIVVKPVHDKTKVTILNGIKTASDYLCNQHTRCFSELSISFKKIKIEGGFQYNKLSDNKSDHNYAITISFTDASPVFKKILIGQYNIRAGQGLIFGSQFPPFLRNPVSAAKKKQNSVTEAANRSRVNRCSGVALSLQSGRLEWKLFFSLKKYYTKFMFSDNGKKYAIHPLKKILGSPLPGIVEDYQQHVDTIKETLYGGECSIKIKEESYLRCRGCWYSYNFEIAPPIDRYSVSTFRGKDLLNLSLDGDFNFLQMNFFGEIAFSIPFNYSVNPIPSEKIKRGCFALLGGVRTTSKKLDTIFLYRNICENFHAPLGGIAIKRKNGALGLFSGLQIKHCKSIRISLSIDFFSQADTKTEYPKKMEFQEYQLFCTIEPFNYLVVEWGTKYKINKPKDTSDEKNFSISLSIKWKPQQDIYLGINGSYRWHKDQYWSTAHYIAGYFKCYPTPHTKAAIQIIAFHSQSNSIPVYPYIHLLTPFHSMPNTFYGSGTVISIYSEEKISTFLTIGLQLIHLDSLKVGRKDPAWFHYRTEKNTIAIYIKAKL